MPFDMPEEFPETPEFTLKYFVRVLWLNHPNERTSSGVSETMYGLFDTIEEMALWCKSYSATKPRTGYVLEAIRILKK